MAGIDEYLRDLVVGAYRVARGKYLGNCLDSVSDDEAQHFIQCPDCGGYIDCRDLGSVFDHEGPLPHATEDKPQ